jgi:alkyl sulfatase BDS1-like metallo-beta-lactamase superfamily hydrolase
MIESHSLSDSLFAEAEKAARDGEYTKALEYLDQVLIMNPRHARARGEKEKWIRYLAYTRMNFASSISAPEMSSEPA